MADWFRAIPNSLETIAYASKFQQETMAAQIRHLKSKVLQYRGIVEQLRREVAELQRYLHYAYDPPYTGKGRTQDQNAPDPNHPDNRDHEFQGFPQQGGQRFKALIPPRQRPDVRQSQGSHTQVPRPGPAPRLMGPPPTPRHLDRAASMRPPPSARRDLPGLFKPSVSQNEQLHHYGRPTNAPQRFLPGSGNSRPQQIADNGQSRQANGASETRIPFMPGTQGSSFG
ncbi:hypothetical protein EYR36_000647 [Pleurotus pulmonarius]|nr:hypothetical protein EYR36_000647 [Pleurotus pulmonarius]